jgi:hypothetical protein
LARNQRKLATQQLALTERLLTLLAEIDRLATLLDGEVLCHAELCEIEDGPALISFGTCEAE